jgi:hypothetical protein
MVAASPRGVLAKAMSWFYMTLIIFEQLHRLKSRHWLDVPLLGPCSYVE